MFPHAEYGSSIWRAGSAAEPAQLSRQEKKIAALMRMVMFPISNGLPPLCGANSITNRNPFVRGALDRVYEMSLDRA
jgi:hypothetical protein